MSRGLGKVERQILAVLEADGGAHVWVTLEALVYAVAGYIHLDEESVDPWERSRPVCDCKPYRIPGCPVQCYDHTAACYPYPEPPAPAQVSAIERAVRSLERKGRLQSARVGRRLSTWWGSGYPGRVTFVWRAETPLDVLPQDLRVAWLVQHG